MMGGYYKRFEMSENEDIWVWLDLEMTGLIPSEDQILEVACVLTNAKGEKIGDAFSQVVYAPEKRLESMDTVCVDMHKSSGLWGDVIRSKNSIESVESALLSFITNHTAAHQKLFLCGNSIHVDRAFVKQYMRSFDHILHYRMIDVTSIGMFVNATLEAMQPFTKAKSHRALDDIEESIAEFKYYQALVQHEA